MDPITAIGAVASIVQLAQVAFSLSKTLYSLGAAIATASDDIQLLADDMRTFSQSLTLLSRLLEDSKSWYSDDIYLLTAKIIKDCADLYVKIDKLLVKLGGKGKSTWKMRVKFVYKEGQIRKLLSRLRDMKGTLATILMSLQVDLQLSLLNISSSSKIQRAPEKPLQRETIQTLVEAQIAAQESGFLSRLAIRSEQVVHTSEKGFGFLTTQYEEFSQVTSKADLGMLSKSSPEGAKSKLINSSSSDWTGLTGSHTSPGIPSILSTESRSNVPKGLQFNSVEDIQNSSTAQFPHVNLMAQHQIDNTNARVPTSSAECGSPRSLKSMSSFDSFQSAVSVIQSGIDVPQAVEAVRNVLHAFRTSLEVLQKLMEKRLRNKEHELYFAAKGLEGSLTEGEKVISATHGNYCNRYGSLYCEGFTDSHTSELQTVSSMLMEEVVMVLHIYSAEHVSIQRSDFEALHACSDRYQLQTICQIREVASRLGGQHPEIKFVSRSSYVINEPVAREPVYQSIELPLTNLPLVGHLGRSESLAKSGQQSISRSSDQNLGNTSQWEVNLGRRQTSPNIRSLNRGRAKAPSSASSYSSTPRSPSLKLGLENVTYDPRISPASSPSGMMQLRNDPKEKRALRSSQNSYTNTDNQERQLTGRIRDHATSMDRAPITPVHPKRRAKSKVALSPQHDPPHVAFAEDEFMTLDSLSGENFNSFPDYKKDKSITRNSPAKENFNSFLNYGGSSAVMGTSYSIHGHTVPVPEWPPLELGLDASTVVKPMERGGSHGYYELSSSFDSRPVHGDFVDPSILRPTYPSGLAAGSTDDMPTSLRTYQTSPAASKMSRSPRPIKAGSQSPYLSSQFNSYLYPPPRRPSVMSHHSYSSQDNFSSDESREKGRCTYPKCGKVFKDLKAHMRTHQNERLEKCPIQTCDYHIKGFARKYDKNRHTLTHFKGTMVCGFCPGYGSAAEKSFNRADVFKRHLTSVHGVEQNVGKHRANTSQQARDSNPTGEEASCSNCSNVFRNAQDFYEHLDDCILLVLQTEYSDYVENTIQTEQGHIPMGSKDFLLHDAKDPHKLMYTGSSFIEFAISDLDRRPSLSPDFPRYASFNSQKPLEAPGSKRLKRDNGLPSERNEAYEHSTTLEDSYFESASDAEDVPATENPEPSSRADPGATDPNLNSYFSSGNSDKVISATASESDMRSSRPTMNLYATSRRVAEPPSLASDQFKKLWWQAYCSLSISQPKIFECLSTELGIEFGAFDSKPSEQNLSKSVKSLIEKIEAKEYDDRHEMKPLTEYRNNIVKVVMTISSQLGLEMPAIGWACVGVVLAIQDHILEILKLTLSDAHLETVTNSFQQLLDIVGLIARYAVMENLYHQSPSLTLTPQYRDGLMDLCATMLQYFAHTFIVMRGIGNLERETRESVRKCQELVEEIKTKDKACQGFRVVIEANNESDSESEDAEIEDVSDES